MNDWTNDLETPSMLSNNFFELVPPTPGQSIQGLRPTSTYHPPNPTTCTTSIDPARMQPHPANHDITPHLGPAPSFASWRTHRSGSSTDSRASSYSNLGSWETIHGHSGSDTSTDSDQGMNGILGQMNLGLESMGSGRPKSNIAKPVSLSIDPNLFRPKSGVGAMSTGTARPVQKPDGDEEMPTAKPKKGRGGLSPKGKKVSHARKHNTDHIPRPRNAFILFRKHVVDAKLIPASVEIRHQNVSVIVAKMWADAPPEKKDRFNELAKVEKEEHMKKYPGYRYQPVYRRTNVIRRRVRKDEAEEEKCKNVAELLLKGKSGEQLEVEIKEKMQQPLITKPSKSRKISQANELSKGALRALRAAARAQAESERSDSQSQSRSQSISSRAGSIETDPESESQAYHSRRGSIISDIDLGSKFDMGTFGFNQTQLRHDGYQFGSAQGLGQGYSLDGGMGGWAPMLPGQSQMGQGQMQQTWAYPEQDQSMLHMPGFAYQQPAPMDPFFNYDQALPFSPTANQFSQTFSFPQAGLGHMANTDQTLNPVSYNMPYFSQTQQMQQQPTLQPPQSARWDVSFQPGGEGLPFDENALLGDFGAALLQAEEMGVW